MAKTLLQMRKLLVARTGRSDLAVDPYGSPANWADNGANYFLNCGQRLLDRLHRPSLDLNQKFSTVLSAGDRSVGIMRSRIIEAVRVVGSDGESRELSRSSERSLVLEYGKELDFVEVDTPRYFAKSDISYAVASVAQAGEEIYENTVLEDILLGNGGEDLSALIDAARHFSSRDADSDGKLTEAESGLGTELFESVDGDSDGYVTKEELGDAIVAMIGIITFKRGWLMGQIFDNSAAFSQDGEEITITHDDGYPEEGISYILSNGELNLNSPDYDAMSDLGVVTVTMTVTIPAGETLVIGDMTKLFWGYPDFWYDDSYESKPGMFVGAIYVANSGTIEFAVPSRNPVILNFLPSDTVTLSNISIKSGFAQSVAAAGKKLWIIPPASEDLNVHVEGHFYTPELEEDSDTSYWTEEEVYELLLEAAVYEHEKSLRNMTGAREAMEHLKQKLADINMDYIEDEVDSQEGPLIIEG